MVVHSNPRPDHDLTTCRTVLSNRSYAEGIAISVACMRAINRESSLPGTRNRATYETAFRSPGRLCRLQRLHRPAEVTAGALPVSSRTDAVSAVMPMPPTTLHGVR